MLTSLADWLTGSSLNIVLSDTRLVAASQSVHILAVAIAMMSVAMINLRLLGLAGTRQTSAKVIEQLMPWVWASLAVLLLTGMLQTIAEPARELLSRTFWFKMSMLAVAVLIAAIYQRAMRKDDHYWEASRDRRNTARALATVSLFLWVAIVAAGRLIAYI
jgi:hypothetical protein